MTGVHGLADRVKNTYRSCVDRYDRKFDIAIFILFLVAICVIAINYIYIVSYTEVALDYFLSADAIANGVLPFQEYNDISWEFPPLAYVFILIPRLFTSDPMAYQSVYIVMTMMVTMIGLALIMLICRRYEKRALIPMGIYLFAVYIQYEFFFCRLDVIVCVLTLAAVYLYLEKRYPWAFILLAIGMLVKLYPGILFLIFLMPFIISNRKNALRYAVLFTATALVLFIPFFIMSPDNVFSFISYHSDRGIQIESVAASFVLVVGQLGLTTVFSNNMYWSFNLEGGLADTILPLMMPLLIVMILGFYVAYYLKCKNESDDSERFESVVIASFAVLLIFIVFNKVFSAQYILWILFMLIPLFIRTKSFERCVFLLLASVAVIMITDHIVNLYGGLVYQDPYVVCILFIRNIIVIMLMALAVRYSGIYGPSVEYVKNTAKSIKNVFKRTDS